MIFPVFMALLLKSEGLCSWVRIFQDFGRLKAMQVKSTQIWFPFVLSSIHRWINLIAYNFL